MNQPIRIIENTPLGYIIEIIESAERLMIPKKILGKKIKEKIYFVETDSSITGELR